MRRVVGSLLLLGLVASCHHLAERKAPTADIRLVLETREPGGTEWVLPESGVHIFANPQSVVDQSQIAAVDVVTLELGKALLVQLTPGGAKALARTSPTAGARRLVLVIDNIALGVVRLDRSVQDGRLAFFVETPEARLADLVRKVKPALERQSHQSYIQ